MTRFFLKDLLKIGAGVILGVATHHYGGQMLNKSNADAEAKAQEIKDGKTDEMINMLKDVKSMLDDCMTKVDKSNENAKISTEMGNKFKSKLDEMVESAESLKELHVDANTAKILDQKMEIVKRASIEIKEMIDHLSNGKNNFLSDFNLQVLYDFLDSLTLLEESAFIHLLVFFILLMCIFNIISIFFGNEMIRYFKLEERFPKLGLFFKLRATFQRYYLIWNLFIMVSVSLLGIFLNLLVFY
uniref:LAGLIDADG endonuclease n=1 Tax=Trametes coccinea TaxID=158605 RepID=A0A7S9A2A8_TRACO|nr:LAGLIDADG endonuclease [Trametes coccinea]QPF23668.1 LAGLIDADG endonuclease [Trametes coccinea]